MKKLLFMLCLLLPCYSLAGDCVNPIGEQYGMGVTILSFGQAYAPGPPDGILHVFADGEMVAHIPYSWDQAACQAALDMEPPLWLHFDEGWLEISNYPRYAFAPVTSVD